MVDAVGCRLFLFEKREYISVVNNWSVSYTGKENYSQMTISTFNYKCNTYMRESTMSFIDICFRWDNEE